MASESREVTLVFKGNVSDAQRALRSLQTSTTGFQSGFKRAMGAVGSTAKAALGAVVLGTAALGVSAVKVGWDYNALEQRANAALTTLLGSAQAASDQMDKLREFGRTSPFPRQVWIRAQQQLLAFGMEAERIIPTFEAVQDAVAAAGGTSESVEQITFALAKVVSTGKVTSQTLLELGYRGIDAAGLIGDAMGKTAGQIREDISSGAISAEEFISRLTDAMNDKFGGAAANLKKTWTGAVDRIKGAFRDIGSNIAEPFVSKQGGGAAVEWANALGDAMWALEGKIKPLIERLAREAAPAFLAITDGLRNAKTAIDKLDVDKFADSLLRLAPAITGVGVAVMTKAAGLIPFLGNFAHGINPVVTGIAAFVMTSPEMRNLLRELFDALSPLIPPLTTVAELLTESLGEALGAIASMLTPVIELIGGLVDAFTSLPDFIQEAVIAAGAFAIAIAFSGPVGTALALIGALALSFKSLRDGIDSIMGRSERARSNIEGLQTDIELLAKTGEVTGDVLGGFGRDLENIADLLGDAGEAYGGWLSFTTGPSAVENAKEEFSRLDTVLSQLVRDDKIGTAADAVKQFEDAARAAGIPTSELYKILPLYQEEMARAAAESKAAGDAQFFLKDGLKAARDKAGGSIESMAELEGALDETSTAADDLKQSFDDLMTSLFGAEEAADAQQTTLNRLKEEIQAAKDNNEKFSKSLEGSSQQAIDNRETIRTLVQQTADMIAEDVRAGDTKDEIKEKTKKYKKELEKELEQLGFNIDKVDDYTDVLDEVPDQVDTGFSTPGYASAKERIEEITKIIGKVKGKNIALDMNGRVFIDGKPVGGRLASGGPVSGPGTGTSDSIPAWLSHGEHVWTAEEVRNAGGHGAILAMRRMFGKKQASFEYAAGGPVNIKHDIEHLRLKTFTSFQQRMADMAAREMAKKYMSSGTMRALQWAKTQAGKPYIWGGVGPRGYDCSGFMSAITNVIQNKNPYQRRFTSATLPAGLFAKGAGRFSVGWFRGNPGHVAGTLLGVNVESAGGVGVRVGKRARGAATFPSGAWRLKGYDDGGYLMPGWTAAYNGTGKPERVVPNDAPIELHVHIHGTVIGGDMKKVAQDLAVPLRDELRKHGSRNGGRTGL